MVVMTAKVSKTKLLALLLLLAVVIAAVLLLHGSRNADTAEGTVPGSDVSTNERRIAYLAACGWEVLPDPVETQEVLIPEEMSEVYEAYNDLQRSQGFDLTRFAGKQVKRYVYEVTNAAGTEAPVYATLLVSRGSVIGGDVTSAAGSGKMQGLIKKASAQAASPTAESETDAADAADTSPENGSAVEAEPGGIAGENGTMPAA